MWVAADHWPCDTADVWGSSKANFWRSLRNESFFQHCVWLSWKGTVDLWFISKKNVRIEQEHEKGLWNNWKTQRHLISAEVNLSHTLWNQLLLELWRGEFLGQNPFNRVTENCETSKERCSWMKVHREGRKEGDESWVWNVHHCGVGCSKMVTQAPA